MSEVQYNTYAFVVFIVLFFEIIIIKINHIRTPLHRTSTHLPQHTYLPTPTHPPTYTHLPSIQVISDHEDVAEVAVVGVKDALKGHIPLGLLVLNSHCHRPAHEVLQVKIHCIANM